MKKFFLILLLSSTSILILYFLRNDTKIDGIFLHENTSKAEDFPFTVSISEYNNDIYVNYSGPYNENIFNLKLDQVMDQLYGSNKYVDFYKKRSSYSNYTGYVIFCDSHSNWLFKVSYKNGVPEENPVKRLPQKELE